MRASILSAFVACVLSVWSDCAVAPLGPREGAGAHPVSVFQFGQQRMLCANIFLIAPSSRRVKCLSNAINLLIDELPERFTLRALLRSVHELDSREDGKLSQLAATTWGYHDEEITK